MFESLLHLASKTSPSLCLGISVVVRSLLPQVISCKHQRRRDFFSSWSLATSACFALLGSCSDLWGHPKSVHFPLHVRPSRSRWHLSFLLRLTQHPQLSDGLSRLCWKWNVLGITVKGWRSCNVGWNWIWLRNWWSLYFPYAPEHTEICPCWQKEPGRWTCMTLLLSLELSMRHFLWNGGSNIS